MSTQVFFFGSLGISRHSFRPPKERRRNDEIHGTRREATAAQFSNVQVRVLSAVGYPVESSEINSSRVAGDPWARRGTIRVRKHAAERVKHGPVITAGMVVAASIALQSRCKGSSDEVTREATEYVLYVCKREAVSRVGHSLWKASEVDSDQTLHMYIVKHDPFGTAKVVIGVSIALHALLFASIHSILVLHTSSQLMIF